MLLPVGSPVVKTPGRPFHKLRRDQFAARKYANYPAHLDSPPFSSLRSVGSVAFVSQTSPPTLSQSTLTSMTEPKTFLIRLQQTRFRRHCFVLVRPRRCWASRALRTAHEHLQK